MRIRDLFIDPINGFDNGMAVALKNNRNSNLGNLLNAERGVLYVQILYRILLFRRDHELAPLHEDIFFAVEKAQNLISSNEYTRDIFNQDMRQLVEWKILECRIEKERLRGYRDNSKQKFRYSLGDEGLAFIEWLESRLQDELEDKSDDTRSLLGDVSGTLKELIRSFNRFKKSDPKLDDARSILYRLSRLEDLSLKVNQLLAGLNAKLLSFTLQHYQINEVKEVLKELDSYTNVYLKQIYQLRISIIPDLEKLGSSINCEKVELSLKAMEQDELSFSRKAYRNINSLQISTRLLKFYEDGGQLDALCQRIHQSAIAVWKKLSSHLRELERKNHRLEDIRMALKRLSDLKEDQVPHNYFLKLLAPAYFVDDPNYWDDHEKASAPLPRKSLNRKAKSAVQYMKEKKKKGDKPVQSMEEARLQKLKAWIELKILQNGAVKGRFSGGKYVGYDDAHCLLETARFGILSNGRKLNKSGLSLTALNESIEIDLTDVTNNDGVMKLICRDMELRRKECE